jgi:hypothetical protein
MSCRGNPALVSDHRQPSDTFLAAPARESDFQEAEIERAIYGTAWEGTATIEAGSDGTYSVRAQVSTEFSLLPGLKSGREPAMR